MLEKITVFNDHHMIMVSKKAVLSFIGGLLLLTLALMTFFLYTDFDYLLGRKNLAMKVGQISISLNELTEIQKISGVRAREQNEQAFAVELFETLLLAEGGRQLGLDRQPAFIKKIHAFDAALKHSKDSETLARAVFLLEQLAEATRNHLVDNHNYDFELAALPVKTVTPATRLHLRTILAETVEQAETIIAQRLSGIDFETLNASWSRSLYKAVGGDIGWKTAADFPHDVFAGLEALGPGVLAEAFSDEAGTHLFEVISRPVHNAAAAERAARQAGLRDLKRRRLQTSLAELRNNIEHWVNPTLQSRCQVAVNTAPTPVTTP